MQNQRSSQVPRYKIPIPMRVIVHERDLDVAEGVVSELGAAGLVVGRCAGVAA